MKLLFILFAVALLFIALIVLLTPIYKAMVEREKENKKPNKTRTK